MGRRNKRARQAVQSTTNFQVSAVADDDDASTAGTVSTRANVMNDKQLEVPEKWKEFAKNLNAGARIIVCGGKSVGKSTLLLWLCNQVEQPILYVDLDPGQSEFTVPGCISAVVVEGAVSGPNYTHLKKPDRSYVVEIGVENISHYIRSVAELKNFCSSNMLYCQMPCLVNTMGYIDDRGSSIMQNIARIMQPTHIVQIESPLLKENYRHHFTSEYVNSSTHSAYTEKTNHSLMVIPAVTAQLRSRRVQAAKARETVLISYLRTVLRPPNYTFLSVMPYRLKLHNLAFHSFKECPPALILNVVTGKVVTLCIADLTKEHVLSPSDSELHKILPTPPVAECLGFGIVRGIDLHDKYLYLLTPVNKETLEQVNCIIIGSHVLPQSLLFDPKADAPLPNNVLSKQGILCGKPTRKNYPSKPVK